MIGLEINVASAETSLDATFNRGVSTKLLPMSSAYCTVQDAQTTAWWHNTYLTCTIILFVITATFGVGLLFGWLVFVESNSSLEYRCLARLRYVKYTQNDVFVSEKHHFYAASGSSRMHYNPRHPVQDECGPVYLRAFGDIGEFIGTSEGRRLSAGSGITGTHVPDCTGIYHASLKERYADKNGHMHCMVRPAQQFEKQHDKCSDYGGQPMPANQRCYGDNNILADDTLDNPNCPDDIDLAMFWDSNKWQGWICYDKDTDPAVACPSGFTRTLEYIGNPTDSTKLNLQDQCCGTNSVEANADDLCGVPDIDAGAAPMYAKNNLLERYMGDVGSFWGCDDSHASGGYVETEPDVKPMYLWPCVNRASATVPWWSW